MFQYRKAKRGMGATMSGTGSDQGAGGAVPLSFQFLGADSRGARIPFPAAAFSAQGGTAPYIFFPGDGSGAVVVYSLGLVNRYYYAANGTFSSYLVSRDFQIRTQEVVIDWIAEPPTQLVVDVIDTTDPALIGILIQGSTGPFTVDWGDGIIETDMPSFSQHRYLTSGTWTITVSSPDALNGTAEVTTVVEAPAPDFLYEGQLGVGSLLTRRGFDSGNFGSLNPREWEIYRIDELYVDRISDTSISAQLKFFSQLQLQDVRTLTVESGGLTIDLEWNNAGFYTSTSADLFAFWDMLNTSTGQLIPITISGSSPTEPAFRGPFVATRGREFFIANPDRSTDPEALLIGFDLDDEPDPDLFLPLSELSLSRQAVNRIKQKIAEIYGSQG